jgi:hypothetical protein
MGLTVQFDSHTIEFPLVYTLEHDPDVLEYYCQPSTITLEYVSANGRLLRHPHTPDYFVIRKRSAGWVEAKSKDDLPNLVDHQPNRYRCAHGMWICTPGIAYATLLGLTYTVHSSADVSDNFARNATFMDDYLRDPPLVPDEVRVTVKNCLEHNPVISLSDLFDQTRDVASSDEIYTMIVQSEVFVDWNAYPFIESSNVRVFADEETAQNFARASSGCPRSGLLQVQIGSALVWDGRVWTVADIGDHVIALQGNENKFTELSLNTFFDRLGTGRILSRPSREPTSDHPEVLRRCREAGPKEIREANKRMRGIALYLEPGSGRPKDRTHRRHLAQDKQAKELYGNGMIGLCPHTSDQGNRTSRLQEEALQIG